MTPRLGGRLRGALPWVALGAGVLVLAVLSLERGDERLPLDPASTARDGTKALAESLSRLGAEVTIVEDLAPGGADTALVLVDRFDDRQRAQARRFAEEGGTLVVADPSSPLAPDVVPGQGGVLAYQPLSGCALPALAEARTILAPTDVAYEPPSGATGCYEAGEGWWLVADPVGAGVIVSLAGQRFLTNALIGHEDNAVLAAALLAPAPGVRVAITAVDFAPAGAPGERTLTDLIPAGLRLAMLQLLVALAIVLAWRARRLGQPVVEPAEVRLAGSELVVAVGNLLQRAGRRGDAAKLLREDLRRDLAARHGLPPGSDPEQVVAAAARTGADANELRAVLLGPADLSDAELVALARRMEALRRPPYPPMTQGDSSAD